MATYENDWEELAKSSFNEIIKSNVRQSFYLLFVIFESIFLENKSCLDQMFHQIMFFLILSLFCIEKKRAQFGLELEIQNLGSRMHFLFDDYP